MLILIAGIASATIEIKIIQYDPPSQAARIQIGNIGETDYNDVFMKIDNKPEEKVVSLLRPKTAIIKSKIIQPGAHTITVTTKEGKVFAKELFFTKSADIVEDELKKETEERLKREEEQKKQAEEKEKQQIEQSLAKQPEKKKRTDTGLIATTLFLLFVLIILLFFLKKTKKKKPKPKKAEKIAIPKKIKEISKPVKKVAPVLKPIKISRQIIKPETPFQKLGKLRVERKSAFEKLGTIKKGQKELKKNVFEKLAEIKKEETHLFKEISAFKKPVDVKPKTNSIDKLKEIRKRQREAYNQLAELEKQREQLMLKLTEIGKSDNAFKKLAEIK